MEFGELMIGETGAGFVLTWRLHDGVGDGVVRLGVAGKQRLATAESWWCLCMRAPLD